MIRLYFEKPRTISGWKGFLYDPDLNETNNISSGLELTRKLLLEITKMKLAIATEHVASNVAQTLVKIIMDQVSGTGNKKKIMLMPC